VNISTTFTITVIIRIMLSLFRYQHNPFTIIMIVNVIISKPLIVVMITFTAYIAMYIFIHNFSCIFY